MAITYFPFDAGAGGNVTEDQWRKMARLWMETGVLADEDNEFAVAESSPAAMSVAVATGKAWLRGHYVESDAVETKAIVTADPTDDRIDRVVLRADFVANTISIVVLEGTPDPAPTAPALTQSASRWEIGLAQVDVAAAAAGILDANITDERTLVSPVPESGGITALSHEIDTSENIDHATGTWGNLDTDGPELTVPATGTYLVLFQATMQNTSGTSRPLIGVVVGDATPDNSDTVDEKMVVNDTRTIAGFTVMALTLNDNLKLRYTDLLRTDTACSFRKIALIQVA